MAGCFFFFGAEAAMVTTRAQERGGEGWAFVGPGARLGPDFPDQMIGNVLLTAKGGEAALSEGSSADPK